MNARAFMEKFLPKSVADPTLGLYPPTNDSKGGTITENLTGAGARSCRDGSRSRPGTARFVPGEAVAAIRSVASWSRRCTRADLVAEPRGWYSRNRTPGTGQRCLVAIVPYTFGANRNRGGERAVVAADEWVAGPGRAARSASQAGARIGGRTRMARAFRSRFAIGARSRATGVRRRPVTGQSVVEAAVIGVRRRPVTCPRAVELAER